jgi:hypothetical protein
MKVVIPFVQIKSHNPNVRTNDFDTNLDTYFKCIVVSFTSLRFWNPTLTLQLTTNLHLPKIYAKQLEDIGVHTKIIAYDHNPPISFGDTFRGCFYLIDAIGAENENALYLDPDILCVKPIPISEIAIDSIAALDLKFDDQKQINGISPREARILSSKFSEKKFDKVHKHYGGEAIYIPQSLKKNILAEIEEIWLGNKRSAADGRLFLPTEEHIFSIAFSSYAVEDLNSIILRIWTTLKYSKAEGGDLDVTRLSLWHLPAEKSHGFRKAYRLYERGELFTKEKNGSNINFMISLFNVNKPYFKKLLSRNLFF